MILGFGCVLIALLVVVYCLIGLVMLTILVTCYGLVGLLVLAVTAVCLCFVRAVVCVCWAFVWLICYLPVVDWFECLLVNWFDFVLFLLCRFGVVCASFVYFVCSSSLDLMIVYGCYLGCLMC